MEFGADFRSLEFCVEFFVFLRGSKEVGGVEEEKRRGKKSEIWVLQKKKKKKKKQT